MTKPPRQSLTIAYTATRPDAITVPIAEPAAPNAGIGPSPRIRMMFSIRFNAAMTTPRTIGVRASPAERSAPPSIVK